MTSPVSPAQFCLLLGIFLVVAEFAVPGVMVCFFGLAAIILAGIFAVFPGMPFSAAIAIYIVLSLSMVFGLRRFVPGVFRGRTSVEGGDPDDDAVAGSLVVVTEAVSPDSPGKVEFRGSLWSATSSDSLAAGDHAVVESRENLTLRVRAAPRRA